MIAHRINRERKASSPARLIKYMVAAKGGIDPTSWERTADYILDSANGTTEGEKVASYRVTNCGTDDPADAAILIQATQAANTRSKAEKTYHFVYSFPPGEQPDLETLHAIEDELCAAIGLDEHQRVSAVHIDTDNLHVHVAINKVHPTGLQNIEPYYDQFRLMEACERLEVEHGLQRTFHGLEAKQRHQNRDIELLPEKAPEQRDSLFREHLRNAYDLSISEPPEAKTLNGLRKLSDTRLQKQSADKAEPVRIGAKVASVEAQSGIETLTGYAARELAPAMRQATSWQELHDAAAEHGNAEALAVLRDREERTRRWNGELLTADRADKAKAVVLDKLKPKARKDGTMTYSTIDGGMVIDRKTHVQAQKATTGAALVALELASKRFEGQALIVEGTDEFRLEVAQLAGMHGLKVTFTDPAMEQMRRETAEHKEMEKAFQTEVYAPKDTKKGEGSKMPGVAPQRRQKQPKDRSNGLI